MSNQRGIRRPNEQRPVNPNDTAYLVTVDDIKNGLLYLHMGAFSINAQDLRAYQLVTEVPVVQNVISYVALVLNVLLPGIGTIVAALISEPYAGNKAQIVVGFF